MIQQFHFWVYIQQYLKQGLCTPMFIAVLFTIAETWKQPKCPSMNEWINKTWDRHTTNGRLFSLKKERNSAIRYNMDEPWGHYARGDKQKKTNTGVPGWLSLWSIRLLISAQVTISRFVGSSQVRLCTESIEPASDPLSPSFSACSRLIRPCTLSLFLSQK